MIFIVILKRYLHIQMKNLHNDTIQRINLEFT